LAPARMAVWLNVQLNGVLSAGGDNEAVGFTQNTNTSYADTVAWHIGQRIKIKFNEAALRIAGQLELGLVAKVFESKFFHYLINYL
jgi:hypothetical protein